MFSWPTWSRFKVYLLVTTELTVLFCVIYGTTNWWAMQAPYRFQFWMNWELGLPFVPGLILAYFSLNLLTLMPLFFLDEVEIKILGRAMLWATLVAGVFFFIFPAPMAQGQLALPAGWETYYQLLYTWDRPGNTLPSLHITYSWMVVYPVIAKSPRWKYPFLIWMSLICVAVVFVKQHYVADVLAGLALGTVILAWRYFPRLP